ncbi:addiction module protein [Saccharomonospora piscinae]|uniref:addiction module protein n=1 Tax=Saccharomonospora piscinae TaxID=687388 RepID=UPI0004B176CE|nr:addiction module protein [Saccharomonospora piscinae]
MVSADPDDLSVAEARDDFSQCENRAAFDEVTAEEYLDQQDGRIAHQRLEEIRSGEVEVMSAEDVARELGL